MHIHTFPVFSSTLKISSFSQFFQKMEIPFLPEIDSKNLSNLGAFPDRPFHPIIPHFASIFNTASAKYLLLKTTVLKTCCLLCSADQKRNTSW